MKPRLWSEYFELLMDYEGEYYEHDSDDPGGATKYGIDQRSHPSVNIRSLTRAQAEQIFLGEFHESFSADLPAPISLAVYDFRVNAGEGAAAKAMQRALPMGVIDGQIGPLTREAIRNSLIASGQEPLITRFTGQRMAFYIRLADQLPKRDKYRKGWLRRARTMAVWAISRLPK